MIHGSTLSSVASFALVAVLSALTALADASPPDPSWMSGVYDENDFDDIVGFITSGASLVDDVTTRDLRAASRDLHTVPPRRHPLPGAAAARPGRGSRL